MIANDGPSIPRAEREAKRDALARQPGGHGFETACECAFCHDLRTNLHEARAVRRNVDRSVRGGIAILVIGSVLEYIFLRWATHEEGVWLVVVCVMSFWSLWWGEMAMLRRWWALRRYV